MLLAWNQGSLGPFWLPGAPESAESLPGYMVDSSYPGPLLKMNISVVDTRQHYLPGSTVEVWHADQNGHYDTSDAFSYRRLWNVLGLHGEIDVTTALPGAVVYNGGLLPLHIFLQVEPPLEGPTAGLVTDWRGHIDLVLPPWNNPPDLPPQGDPRAVAQLAGPYTAGFGGREWYLLTARIVLEYENDPYYTNSSS